MQKSLIVGILSTLLLISCGGGNADEEFFVAWRVATSSPQIAQWVRTVGSERVIVLSLIPNGTDSSSYAPEENDYDAVANAEIFFYDSGKDGEWVTEVLVESDRRIKEGMEVMMSLNTFVPYEEIPRIDLNGISEERYAKAIADAFIEFDPEGEEVYRSMTE